jgi:hypothetical protein
LGLTIKEGHTVRKDTKVNVTIEGRNENGLYVVISRKKPFSRLWGFISRKIAKDYASGDNGWDSAIKKRRVLNDAKRMDSESPVIEIIRKEIAQNQTTGKYEAAFKARQSRLDNPPTQRSK